MRKSYFGVNGVRSLSLLSFYIAALALLFTFVSCSDDDDDGYEVSGMISEHYYVDLGLSVKWATCNVGANSPEEYGNYYAWGEIETKDSYTISNSVTYRVEMDDISGDAEYDAATANWGNPWRMPTYDEVEELLEECSWKWTSRNGIKGYLVKGTTGNSIFLPAAGDGNVNSVYNQAGEAGFYWSSTPDESDTSCAYSLDFASDIQFMFNDDRDLGCSVRPVSE